jgi:aspartyl-tRNA synthetase
MYRTHTCNELTASDESKKVKLAGWVHRRRDHGGLIFIDLRDGYGLTQIVFDPENKESFNIGDECRSEYVIEIEGKVRLRPEGQTNNKLQTGEIEILVEKATILNKAKTPPFEVDQDKEVSEELRLKYRYIDLRRERMHKNIVNKHKIFSLIRQYLDKQDFLDIETPMMIKGTPEGSREYLVPSRLFPGHFYVLPQSPQQLKQLLMIASFDKYYQMARCFRDEDLRGDRQPEFTQLDLEMSFVHEDDVMQLTEDLMITLSKELYPDRKLVFEPFKRITWHDAMNEYGSDKPDLRFEMKLTDVSETVATSDFQVFSNTIQLGGVVKALRVKDGADFTRKEIDELEEIAKTYRAKGLAYIKFNKEGEVEGGISKFLKPDELNSIKEHTKAQNGDIVFFAADKFQVACESLGQVRLACAKKMNLIDEDALCYLWVTNFPMFHWNEEEQQMTAEHHPFTHPLEEDLEKLDSNPEEVCAYAYDIVLNGVELGGGSIRIHEPELQAKIFELLKITPEDAEKRFGHLLRAFKYGAPPHGGIALGMERIVMILEKEPNIREVMAFPKDQRARDLMLDAPSEMPVEQVSEMHIDIRKPKK